MKNRKRNRMQGFDYSSDNLYFVTICVKDRICCFGSVISMESSAGTGRDLSVHNQNEINQNEINQNEINQNEINPNKIDPNEIHPNESMKRMELNNFGKIVYDRIMWLEEQYQYLVLHNFVVMPNHVHAIIGIVGTGRDLSVQIKIKSLSSLMGAFKTTSSKLIHQAGFLDFAWQRSFHDHIIRNEKSYLNISNYIDTNPEKWTVDTFYEKDQNNSN